jgi:hypothetical protein
MEVCYGCWYDVEEDPEYVSQTLPNITKHPGMRGENDPKNVTVVR